MPYITTLLQLGGMLQCPIPRALVRELGLLRRERVYVARGKGRTLIIEPLEDYLAERRAVQRTAARADR